MGLASFRGFAFGPRALSGSSPGRPGDLPTGRRPRRGLGRAQLRFAVLRFGASRADGESGAGCGRFAVLAGAVLDWRRGLGGDGEIGGEIGDKLPIPIRNQIGQLQGIPLARILYFSWAMRRPGRLLRLDRGTWTDNPRAQDGALRQIGFRVRELCPTSPPSRPWPHQTTALHPVPDLPPDLPHWLLLAEGHLNRRLFGDMLPRIWALPLPSG